MASFKNWLAALHRWLGLGGSLLFLVWFLSGIAMMYVEMPYLYRSDAALDHLPPLRGLKAALSPAQAFAAAGLSSTPKHALLVSCQGRAAYRFLPAKGSWVTVFADDGSRLAPMAGPQDGAAAAEAFKPGARAAFDRVLSIDQWTVYGHFNPHRPLYRYRLNDPARTWVHVSSATREVVQATNARERFLALLGPIPHWIYPVFIRKHSALWVNLVVLLAGLGSLLCLSGIVSGLWQWRRSRPAGPPAGSPYRPFWLRWHHLFGLAFGFIAFTWVFSGWLSMTPFDWVPSSSPTPAEQERFRGGQLDLHRFERRPTAAFWEQARALGAREAELGVFDGEAMALLRRSPKLSALMPWHGGPALARLDDEAIRRAAARLHPGRVPDSVERLDAYDAYYYSKLSASGPKRLPVYRIRFEAENMAYYADPHSGALLQVFDPMRRWNRWLYHGLHSFDHPALFNKRPWWDLVMLAFLLAGSFLSLTAVALTLRWMRLRGLS